MPLSIYTASAGSGKTYRLTLSFLELIFKNPQAYRHILAVTFTNKAAREMKYRILERLHDLSQLKQGESSNDLETLSKNCALPSEEVIERANDLLVRILNDYSRFNIGTIDRFFQGVIRAFTKEIGLPAGFGLELDKDRVLTEAVDRMLQDLGSNKDLFQWVLQFANLKMEEAGNWKFKHEFQKLGEQLFSESYQAIVADHDVESDKEELHAFLKKIAQEKKDAEEKLKSIAQKALQELETSSLDEGQFAKISLNYIKKSSEGNWDFTDAAKERITNEDKWLLKKSSEAHRMFAIHTLMPALADIRAQSVELNTYSEATKHIYALGILKDLSAHIQDITEEKNLFLISNSSRFLKGIIGNNPTPFVYEKTAIYLDHIMLDEFQDTSAFQWDNFYPLLDHTLSTEKENVVVGDVKQSIYRWRNTDWKILARDLPAAFPESQIDQQNLGHNWRSSEEVIRFNNTIFKYTPEILYALLDGELESSAVSPDFRQNWLDLLKVAYKDVEQQIPQKSEGSGGYVRGELLEEESKTFKEIALERIPEWIRELQDKNYAPGDIAILVRKNSEAADVAKILMEEQLKSDDDYNFSFVSNEALYLTNNIAIRFIVTVLTYLHKPSDEVNILHLKYYFLLLKGRDQENLHATLTKEMNISEVLGETFRKRRNTLQRLPLYELVEELISIFALNVRESDLPYIQAFQENMVEIMRNNPGSLHDFLSYWEEFGDKKALAVSEEQDAIKITSIHKSKGLEYKAVLVPFCNWPLVESGSGDRTTIIWQDTRGTTFDALPVLPLSFSSKLKETHFAERYMEEAIMMHVDSLNLLYVACTRAEQALFLGIPPSAKSSSKLSNVGQLLMHTIPFIPEQNSHTTTAISNDIEAKRFEVGELGMDTKEEVEVSATKGWKINAYPLNLREDSLRLHLKNQEYFEVFSTEDGSKQYFGNLMHEIFSRIEFLGDVEKAVQKYVRMGVIGEADGEELVGLIQEKLNQAQAKELFADGNELFLEKEIFSDGRIYRPDRVVKTADATIVVDYKFGERNDKKYQRQLQQYMALLKNMGFENLKGYVWYVMLDEWMEVV